MRNVAHLSFRGGGFIIPVRTPYDRQLLFEHLAQYAKRHGRIFVELNGERWTITVADAQTPLCARCNQQPDNLSYRSRDVSLCHPCARGGAMLAA